MADLDAVVLAGGVPQPGEPLYPVTQGQAKALLPIGGVPMLQWVLDALSGAECVRRVVVIGLPPDAGPLECRKTLGSLPNQGSMIANAEAGVQWVLGQDTAARHALFVSADIPALTPEIVDWVVRTAQETDDEVYYSLVPAADMERRFPGSNRTFFKLKDGRFTGSDINVFATGLIGHFHPAWRALVEARKNILKQASLIGLDTLLLMALGQLSIADAERRAEKRLGVRGRAMICHYAEAGMDVDKPHQYEIVKRDLEARGRRV
jgi:molybdopterin-guanine dinucleotide biosynthesis protein A